MSLMDGIKLIAYAAILFIIFCLVFIYLNSIGFMPITLGNFFTLILGFGLIIAAWCYINWINNQ